jgi:hypothetical protein
LWCVVVVSSTFKLTDQKVNIKHVTLDMMRMV